MNTPKPNRNSLAAAFLWAACSILTVRGQEAAKAPATAPAPETANSAKKDEVVVLSTFEVTSSRDTEYQARNSVDVTRMDTPIKDIPMNVTVFNQQFIEDLLARETEDVLAYDPSVQKVSENDGFMVRGIKNASTNFLNGFPLEEGLGSQPLANIDRVTVIKGPNAVIFGTGGFGGVVNRETKRPRPNQQTSMRAIFGEEDSWRVEFDHNQPLDSRKKYLMRVNGAYEDGIVNSPWRTPRKEKSLGTAFTWNIAQYTQLNVEYFYNQQQRQAQWGAPIVNGDPDGITTGDGVYHSYGDRRMNFNDPSDNRKVDRHILMTDFRHSFTRNIEFRSQILYEHKQQDNVETQALPEGLIILRDAVLLPRSWGSDKRWQDNYRIRNEVLFRFKTAGLQHRVITGFAYADQQLEFKQDQSSRNFGGITNATYLNATNGIVPVNQMRYDNTGVVNPGQTASQVRDYRNVSLASVLADPRVVGLNPNLILPINIFDRSQSFAVPDFANRAPLLPNIRRDTYARNTEVYLNDITSFWNDKIYLNLGARFVRTHQWRSDRLSGSSPSAVLLATPTVTERWDQGYAHNIGMVFHLDKAKRFSLYGNLNHSFEPQAQLRVTVDGEFLDPEEGNQQELGLKFDLADGRFQGLVTYFHLDHKNVSGADPVNTGFFIPLDARKTEGLEVGYNLRVRQDWSVFGGYAYTDTKDDAGYKRFISSADRSPRHAFTFFNRWNNLFTKGLALNLGAIYTGKREIAQTNINATRRGEPFWGPLPATWRVDTSVNYSFRTKRLPKSPLVTLSFRVSNVLDETDILYYMSEYEWRAQPGREIEFAVGLRF